MPLNHTLRFYLFEREHERGVGEVGGAEGEREADSPLSREPDVGLNPKTHHYLSQRQTLNQLSLKVVFRRLETSDLNHTDFNLCSLNFKSDIR